MSALDLGRLVIGLLATAIVLVFAARRVQFLVNLIRSGQAVSSVNGLPRSPAHIRRAISATSWVTQSENQRPATRS